VGQKVGEIRILERGQNLAFLPGLGAGKSLE
jgi:hypothetical protein